jgi:cysteine desulfurase
MDHIYLDYAATTPVAPEVLEAMLPWFHDYFGNPSSTHWYGQKAEGAVESAREVISDILGCTPPEIIFTSGGSEADNLALRGTALARKHRHGATRLLISPLEHDAVIKTARQLTKEFGFSLELLPVDRQGRVNILGLERMLRPDVALVSAIYGNNEIGTINPVSEIARICHASGIPFHTDAVQALGYCPVTIKDGFDLLSAGAHKFYGPKGVGFLYKQKDIDLLPTQTGGAQERNLRAGTQNVPYIVGMAAALKLARENLDNLAGHYIRLRDEVIRQILAKIPGASLTGDPVNRLANHASFIIPGVDGNRLVMALDMAGFCVSSGSACKTGNPEPSEVLLAVGYTPEDARASLRVSVGRSTNMEDVNQLVGAVKRIIGQMR